MNKTDQTMVLLARAFAEIFESVSVRPEEKGAWTVTGRTGAHALGVLLHPQEIEDSIVVPERITDFYAQRAKHELRRTLETELDISRNRKARI